MNKVSVGIIREGKNPPDKRVPLTPLQCKELVDQYPQLELLIQPSPIRAYKDEEYAALGLKLQEDLSACDMLLGVKEVPIDQLIPEKTYLFFSHTFKKQPYNRKLLKAILDKKIRLIDYEVLTDAQNQRIIGFGRWAGIVGCYNSFRTYGLKTGTFSLKKASDCFDRNELEAQLAQVVLDKNFKLVLTGWGRVGLGARETLKLLNIQEVNPTDFLNQDYDFPVFTQLEVGDYNAHKDGKAFDRDEFFKNAENFVSSFPRYLQVADLYIACHYHGSGAPYLVTREDLKDPKIKTRVVGDISADIDGPVACTIRPSTIADPIYGYHPESESEVDFNHPEAIAVMAIDNLPCELPRDASEDFGNMMMKGVLPYLLGTADPDRIIERASQTNLEGQLMPKFAYLSDYVAQ